MFVNWFMYIWNEAKWGKKLLEKYWNNYYFSSFHHKWPDSIAHVRWGQRDSKDLFSVPLWLPREQSSSSTPRGQGRRAGKRWGQAYQKVGSVTQVPLGWRAVILRKDGGGGASGFLSPLDYTVRWSSQQEAGDAACLLPTPHVVSVDDQLLNREQPPQIELKQRANSIHHERFEGQAKAPSLAFHQLFLPLTPAVPKNWCQPWQASSGLVAVAGLVEHQEHTSTPGSAGFHRGLGWTGNQLLEHNFVPSTWHSRWATGH